MPIPSTNSILLFADDGGALVDSQATYSASTQRTIGNQPGIAQPGFVNKTLKQANKIAVAVAEFLANRQATDVVDTLTPTQLELMLSTAINGNTTAVLNAVGTADALVANFAPLATTRQPGIQVAKALASNLTPNPTLARDAQAAKTMVKGSNLPLAPGDIISGGLFAFYWDAAIDKEVLLNPVTGILGQPPQMFSQPNPTLAANEMTLPASTLTLQFRSATQNDGLAPAAITGTIANLVIPAGATLGTVSTVPSTIVEIVMNNAGTMERAIVNSAGGLNLDETGLISTTAISAGSTAANVVYSTTARTNLPYRLVRRIDSTQTVSGNWAQALTLVQGGGGLALNSLVGAGTGKWINRTGSRSQGVTYPNTDGVERKVSIIGNTGASTDEFVATIDGVSGVVRGGYAGTTLYSTMSIYFSVPAGSNYSVGSSGGSVSLWSEGR